MRALVGLGLCAALTVVPTAVAVSAADLPPAPAAVGHVAIVQGVPGLSVDVVIDGKTVESGVDWQDVLGPYPLAPGKHRVDFSSSGDMVKAAIVRVGSGSNQDVVLHLPASPDGAPVVTAYAIPTEPIGPGKARVLVAHTATVGPADVRVDGKVVFSNVANGEFATADVPAGKHVVALLPAGQATGAVLGPVEVELTARTISVVYAVGDPNDGSMTLIVHAARLAADGSLVPSIIGTGTAGLAADIPVTPFGGSSS